MTLVFGSSTSSFNDYAVSQGNPRQFQDNINHLVLYFIYLFIGRFVIGYVATFCICVAAARTTSSLRKAFLESLLRQDVSHFDVQGNGSAATQVTTSTALLNRSSSLLTRSNRWPSCQSRHCRETVLTHRGNFAFLLCIYRCTCCSVEACPYSDEHRTGDCSYHGRLYQH